MTLGVRRWRVASVTLLAIVVAIAAVIMDASLMSRTALVAALCLFLWLSGWVPLWAPTLVLWCATPLLLETVDPHFSAFNVLRWSIDPVLALFLAGFTFAKSAERHGIDASIAAFSLRKSSGSTMRLVGGCVSDL